MGSYLFVQESGGGRNRRNYSSAIRGHVMDNFRSRKRSQSQLERETSDEEAQQAHKKRKWSHSKLSDKRRPPKYDSSSLHRVQSFHVLIHTLLRLWSSHLVVLTSIARRSQEVVLRSSSLKDSPDPSAFANTETVLRMAGLDIRLSGQTKALLDHCEDLNSRDAKLCTVSPETGWTSFAIRDTALFCGTIYHWAATNRAILPEAMRAPGTILEHKGKTIRLINDRLRRALRQPAAELIATVACLASSSIFNVDLQLASFGDKDNFTGRSRTTSDEFLSSQSPINYFRSALPVRLEIPRSSMTHDDRVTLGEALLFSDRSLIRQVHDPHTKSDQRAIILATLICSNLFFRNHRPPTRLLQSLCRQLRLSIQETVDFGDWSAGESDGMPEWLLQAGAAAASKDSVEQRWFLSRLKESGRSELMAWKEMQLCVGVEDVLEISV
ncbi:MAG: hypothetical protein Q9227_009543 [Pyrenula ochraceoflavens]